MLNEIKRDLADNFREGDEAILKKLIDEVTTDALSISNRQETDENIEILSIYIKQCVKELYLQRGAEGSTSFSDAGKSTSFVDPLEQMRVNIVKSGKRKFFI